MDLPIFVISDLHIGSGGSRDSFSQNRRNHFFDNFLDYVEKENGELIILGDFIDLWRFALKKVIKARVDLLDRLSEMKVSYVPGNHDQALSAFIDSHDIPHPFFRKIRKPFVKVIGSKRFSFLHGHEFDWFNRNLTPRVGRFLGLSSSIIEYAKGYPVFASDVIEKAILNIEEKLCLSYINLLRQIYYFTGYSAPSQYDWILPRQKRIEKLLSKYEHKKNIDGNDITISAHTHKPCRFKDWYLNSGSWTDQTNNFIRILPNGKADIFNWESNVPRINNFAINRFGLNHKLKTSYVAVN